MARPLSALACSSRPSTRKLARLRASRSSGRSSRADGVTMSQSNPALRPPHHSLALGSALALHPPQRHLHPRLDPHLLWISSSSHALALLTLLRRRHRRSCRLSALLACSDRLHECHGARGTPAFHSRNLMRSFCFFRSTACGISWTTSCTFPCYFRSAACD